MPRVLLGLIMLLGSPDGPEVEAGVGRSLDALLRSHDRRLFDDRSR